MADFVRCLPDSHMAEKRYNALQLEFERHAHRSFNFSTTEVCTANTGSKRWVSRIRLDSETRRKRPTSPSKLQGLPCFNTSMMNLTTCLTYLAGVNKKADIYGQDDAISKSVVSLLLGQ